MKNMKEILIVDNKDDWRVVLAGIVEDEGYKPLTVSGNEKALEMLSSHKDIALVIFGCNEPCIEYHLFPERMKREYPSIPLVCLGDYSPERKWSIKETMENTSISYDSLCGCIERYCR